jgi:HK97 family phage portal protein
MDILARLFGGGLHATDYGPTSDFWYTPIGSSLVTEAGTRVDADSAQMLSAWYRGRDILATVLAMLPLSVYRRLPDDGGSEVAKDHALYPVLHDSPNGWQDSFQWRREKMYSLIDGGWSFDRIIRGPRSFADALHPIHPSLVRVEQVTSGPNVGRYLFHVRDAKTGRTTIHTQDEIFYLRGAGGKGILEYARSNIGTALATESYAAQIFGKGTLNGGTITNPGLLDPEAARRMALSFLTKPGEHHLPKVLEQGSTFLPNTMTPEDAQMLLSRKHSIDDMARWLGIPRQMLENSDPSFGNAEQFDDNFITYTMGPWLSMFEFGINQQLIWQTDQYYAEFTRDAIVRGKFSERAQGNVAYVNAGIFSVDEVRAKENKNKRGGKADELRDPANITGKQPTNQEANPGMPTRGTQAQAIATASAERLLRKEIAAMQKSAVKHAANPDAFAGAVAEFYDGHMALVSETLQLSEADARAYCAGQAAQLLEHGIRVLDDWATTHYAAGLAALALEGEAA